jgi:phosphoglycolate phosphatase-like HAD superfamily hydrolase
MHDTDKKHWIRYPAGCQTPPKAWIFDLDDTLVDSHLDFMGIRRDLGFPPDCRILETLLAQPPEEQARLRPILTRHEQNGAEGSVLIEGVERFINVVESRRPKTGETFSIFTRNTRSALDTTLNKNPILKKAAYKISREDAAPKPNPEGLLLIMKHLGLTSSEVLYVGDYLYDLEAGAAAGIPSLLFWQGSEELPAWSHTAAGVFQHFDALTELLR